MSTAEILSLISLISYIISGVSLVLAIFFWFQFKIPSVIGDLSGRTARKSIARMRANNERAGGKGYQPSAANASRGKLTDTMHHAGPNEGKAKEKPAAKANAKAKKAAAPAENQMPETGLLASNKAEAPDTQQTALLDGGDATGLLLDNEATAPLQEEQARPVRRTGGKKLTMLDEVMLIHTDEVIR